MLHQFSAGVKRRQDCRPLDCLERRASYGTHKGRSNLLNLRIVLSENRFRFSGRCGTQGNSTDCAAKGCFKLQIVPPGLHSRIPIRRDALKFWICSIALSEKFDLDLWKERHCKAINWQEDQLTSANSPNRSPARAAAHARKPWFPAVDDRLSACVGVMLATTLGVFARKTHRSRMRACLPNVNRLWG